MNKATNSYDRTDTAPAAGGARRYHPDRGDITELEHFNLDMAALDRAEKKARKASPPTKAA